MAAGLPTFVASSEQSKENTMLFELYEADPTAVQEYADTLIAKASDLSEIEGTTLEQQAEAAEEVDGELEGLLDEPFQGVGGNASQLALAAGFVAGELTRWATAIKTFNQGVTDLNTQYESAKDAGWGVPHITDMPADTMDDLREEAKSELVAELKRRWAELDGTLDGEADAVNADLREGPTEETVIELFAAGHLGKEAYPLLAGMGLDPKKIESVVADLEKYLELKADGKFAYTAWLKLIGSIADMDPRAAGVILGALSDDQLRELGDTLDSDTEGANELRNYFLAGATPATVDRLTELWGLNPDGVDGWTDADGTPLFPEDPDYSGENGETFIGADQGGIGDCWMLAKLNAIAGADPDWPQEHVRDNGNGTVSVKFYNDDGSAHWVTVTDDLPQGATHAEGDNASTWAVYYEKAAAQDQGGYESLEGGHTQKWDHYMTGTESENIEAQGTPIDFDDPYDDAVEAYKNGDGVIVANRDNDPENKADDDLMTHHEYYIKDVTSEGEIVLGNPHGESDVTLTEDEFDEFVEEASVIAP